MSIYRINEIAEVGKIALRMRELEEELERLDRQYKSAVDVADTWRRIRECFEANIPEILHEYHTFNGQDRPPQPWVNTGEIRVEGYAPIMVMYNLDKKSGEWQLHPNTPFCVPGVYGDDWGEPMYSYESYGRKYFMQLSPALAQAKIRAEEWNEWYKRYRDNLSRAREEELAEANKEENTLDLLSNIDAQYPVTNKSWRRLLLDKIIKL